MGKKYRRYKNIFEKFLDSSNGQRWFNVVYSVGAAIVILGAMFKLLHLPFGNLMLMIGMVTEAIVFLLSALEKPAKDYKWEEVYPVLAEDEQFIPKSERKQMTSEELKNVNNSQPAISTTSYPSGSDSGNQSSASSSQNVDNQRQSNVNVTTGQSSSNNNYNRSSSDYTQSRVGSQDSYVSGNNTSHSSGGINSNIIVEGANVTQASERYADQLNKMTDNMSKFAEVTSSLGHISETLMQSFQSIIDNSQGIGNNTQGYISQLENLNRNIAGLNTIYEIQLKGVSGQIHTIEEINAGLERMQKLYSGSLVDSSLFKNETEKMAKQLAELNTVYSRLLQAMTTNMNIGGGFNNGNINNNTQP